jgi:hypothetical protein
MIKMMMDHSGYPIKTLKEPFPPAVVTTVAGWYARPVGSWNGLVIRVVVERMMGKEYMIWS